MGDPGWRAKYVERFYRSRPGWIDGTTEFHGMLRRHIAGGARVLEIGSGSGNPTSAFLATITPDLVGLEVAVPTAANAFVRGTCLYDGLRLPFRSQVFDAAVSNYVLEHVEHPEDLCGEVHRVLRRGGVFVFRTPNLCHYVSLAGRVMPHWITRWLANWLRALPEGSHEPHRTYYRMNAPGRIRRLLTSTGFEIAELTLVEKEPSYGLRSRVLFLAFLAYERVVNSSRLFQRLRANLFCVARRP